MKDYKLFYSGKPKNERAISVGLLVHKNFEENIKNTVYINDRLLQTSFAFDLHGTKTTHIICVYAPNISKFQNEKDTFYDDLQRILDKIAKQDEIIVLGDFNARVGNEVLGVKNRFSEEILNSNGEQLIHLCAQNELRVNNTFFPHKAQHKYTFQNSRGQRSVI